RWQDAPDLALFLLGADSPRERARYGERKTEFTTALDTRLSRTVRVSAGVGIERYAISAAVLDPHEDRVLEEAPIEPGLSTRPWFSHVFGGALFDTRKTGYARAGTLLDVSGGDYHDWHDGTYSFQHFEGGGQRFFPAGASGSFAISTRVWMTHPG